MSLGINSKCITTRRPPSGPSAEALEAPIPGPICGAIVGRRLAAAAGGLLGSAAGALLVAFVLALAFLTVPRVPLTGGLESSWSAVLSYAHEKGLQFGTHIVYTYGPLGFLSICYFTPETAGLRLLTDATLCFGVAAGVCLSAWRLSMGWRLLALALFTLLAANIHNGAQDLLINIGLLCWGVLCASETRARLRLYASCLVLLAVFGALTKMTGMVIGGLTVSAIAADLWLRDRRRLGLALVLGFIAGLGGGWAFLGQGMSQIPAFLAGGIRIASGYNGAMGLEPSPAALAGGLLTLLVTVAAILMRYHAQQRADATQRWRQRLLFAWLLALVFLTWKHGLVRADRHHAIFFLGFAPLLALMLEALPWPTPRPSGWSRQLAAACCLCAVITLQGLLSPEFLHWDMPFRQAAANAATLLWPGAYREQMARSLEWERRRNALPRLRQIIGRAAVDVFGNYQTYAVFNDLNYRPRPVFQSYSAYTAPLMRMNEQFYSSRAAPEFVLARLGTIDDRLPVLEDASAFRCLMQNYKLTASEGGFLLLKLSSSVTPALALLREGTVRPGERIDLEPYGRSDVWLEIDLEPTAAGRVRQFFYQPSAVWLSVWDGTPARPGGPFRAPASMMAAGFVASPLILSNERLSDFYAGKPVVRPKAYSVTLAPASRFLWREAIRYRIFRLSSSQAGSPGHE